MVEQDMVISRALIELYNQPQVQNSLIFRGGTALNKLIFDPPVRYSEDIDFVQRRPEPLGETLNAIRNALDPWLGNPKRKLTERSAKLVYQYEGINNLPTKLKVEINTTEHFQVLSPVLVPYSMNSEWFKGGCTIVTYELEELLATKLRALYQRRKGRDLFDLWFVFSKRLADIEPYEHDQKRPLQKCFPQIHALNALLRFSGITQIEYHKKDPLLKINLNAYHQWNTFTDEEKYWNLFPILLYDGIAEALGESHFMSHCFLGFDQLLRKGSSDWQFPEYQDQEVFQRISLQPHLLGFFDLFGFIEVTRTKPEPGASWRCTFVRPTSLGLNIAKIISDDKDNLSECSIR